MVAKNTMSVSGVLHSDLTFAFVMNDHHDKSSHLSPYKVITISLTLFLMLYVTSPWLIYFITGGLYLLSLLHLFPTSSFSVLLKITFM